MLVQKKQTFLVLGAADSAPSPFGDSSDLEGLIGALSLRTGADERRGVRLAEEDFEITLFLIVDLTAMWEIISCGASKSKSG